MEKNSVLYQLMDIQINSIMNKIVMANKKYREITRRADSALEKIEAPFIRIILQLYEAKPSCSNRGSPSLLRISAFPTWMRFFRQPPPQS